MLHNSPPVKRVHRQLIEVVRALVPEVTEKGICFGYTMLWLQSVLTPTQEGSTQKNHPPRFVSSWDQQIKFFDRTRHLLAKYVNPNKTINTKKILEELGDPLQWNELKAFKEIESELLKTLQSISPKSPYGQRVSLNTKLDLALGAKAKDYRTKVIRLCQSALGLNLTDAQLQPCDTLSSMMALIKDKHLSELTDSYAFITNLALLHQPDHYEPIYGQRNLHQKDFEVTLPLAASANLIEAHQSLSADPIGLFVVHEDQLTDILKELESLVKQNTTEPGTQITFQLSTDNHSVGFYYEQKLQAWQYLDINVLKEENIRPLSLSTEGLAKHMIRSSLHGATDDRSELLFNLTAISNPRNPELIKNIHALAERHFKDKILKSGLNSVNKNGDGTLAFALKGEDLEGFRQLLKQGANTSLTSPPPLILRAAAYGEPGFIEALIEHGFDVSRPVEWSSEQGKEHSSTPVEVALEHKNLPVLQALVKKGIPLGETKVAFLFAIKDNNLLMLDFFNTHEGRMHKQYCLENKETFFSVISQVVQKGNEEALLWLINEGFLDLKEFSRWRGAKLLDDICTHHNPKMLEFFVKNRAIAEIVMNLDNADKEGETRLQFYCRQQNLPMVEALLKMSADANTEGMAPLLIAISKNNPKLIDLLLKYDVDVNHTTEKGQALDYAVLMHDLNLVRLLIGHGAKVDRLIPSLGITSLMAALQEKDFDMAELLLSQDKHLVEKPNQEGQSPLEIAVMNQDYKSIGWLLTHGADINQRFQPRGLSSLVYAFEKNDPKLLDLLLAQDNLDVTTSKKTLEQMAKHSKALKPFAAKIKEYSKQHSAKKQSKLKTRNR